MVTNGDCLGLNDSLTDFLSGGLVRDSYKLNKTKSVPKILDDDIGNVACDVNCGSAPRHHRRRSTLKTTNKTQECTTTSCRPDLFPDDSMLSASLLAPRDFSSSTRQGGVDAVSITAQVLRTYDFTEEALTDSLTEFVSGGCIRDSGKLSKTKMCKKIEEDIPPKKINSRKGISHRTCKRRGYS